MSHKQPRPAPTNVTPMPFCMPRPPYADEATEEYCRRCDCVKVGNVILPRTYMEWVARQQAEKSKEHP
jgi:hypothetical protein